MGRDGHVEPRDSDKSGSEGRCRCDSAWTSGYGGGNRGPDSFSGFGPGQLPHGRDHQCKWRIRLVRLKLAQIAVAGLLVSAAIAPRAAAQNPDSMMPEQSAAKAKQILRDLINARGGAGYSEAVEGECQGTRAQFGHNGAVLGYVGFTEARHFPDKERLEYSAKSHNLKSIINTVIGVEGLDWSHGGSIVVVYNADRGWTLDRGGITELAVGS